MCCRAVFCLLAQESTTLVGWQAVDWPWHASSRAIAGVAGLDKALAVREWQKLRLATRLQGRAELSLSRPGSAGYPAGSGVVACSCVRFVGARVLG